MDQRPRFDGRIRLMTLPRAYAVTWVLFGLCPPVIAVLDRPAGTKYWTLVVMTVFGLGYGVVRMFPGDAAFRPHAYLGLAVICLGTMGYLLTGGAALYIATLPQFWILARTPLWAVASSGAGAAATVAVSTAAHGPSAGNIVFTGLGYTLSAGVGLLVHRMIKDNRARTARLSADLDVAQRELAEANQRQGAIEERERLAREIHDTLAQGFASIIVLAEAARANLGAAPESAAHQLLSIEQTARENLTEARILVGSAPASGLATGSIAQTLRRTLDRFAQDTGLTVDADLPEVTCDQPIRIALLRCTQESLANVRKHAAATTVGVLLTRRPDSVELEITDDGQGFVVAEARGFGLDGMRRRLAELGGELVVTSAPGEGTRVLATLPTDERG
ncbi:sensor histidine kinase [Dactylosporangium cerinum]|uniref:Oxygen sensor histidine kinase NreB n=1 Tax=Dactylosporangium cerinum TaxID=1434730 RepID=A0ABV9VXI2_9ACTN